MASSSRRGYRTLSVAPPLIVTTQEIDRGIDTLDRHLAIADALIEADQPAQLVELATASSATSDS